MTHEEAMALSAQLVELGQSHTLTVGVHERLAPPVHCRVEITIPPGGMSLGKLQKLEVVTGYDVGISFLSKTVYLEKS